jgi:hypothetical protein
MAEQLKAPHSKCDHRRIDGLSTVPYPSTLSRFLDGSSTRRSLPSPFVLPSWVANQVAMYAIRSLPHREAAAGRGYPTLERRADVWPLEDER